MSVLDSDLPLKRDVTFCTSIFDIILEPICREPDGLKSNWLQSPFTPITELQSNNDHSVRAGTGVATST
jgi:hypothetical protein